MSSFFTTIDDYYSDPKLLDFIDKLNLLSQQEILNIQKYNALIISAFSIDGLTKSANEVYNAFLYIESSILQTEFCELTDDYRHKINLAIEDGYSHNYDLLSKKHRYFFVDKFFETDFKKTIPKGAMGTRIFDLSEILNTDKLPETETIAALLKDNNWI